MAGVGSFICISNSFGTNRTNGFSAPGRLETGPLEVVQLFLYATLEEPCSRGPQPLVAVLSRKAVCVEYYGVIFLSKNEQEKMNTDNILCSAGRSYRVLWHSLGSSFVLTFATLYVRVR